MFLLEAGVKVIHTYQICYELYLVLPHELKPCVSRGQRTHRMSDHTIDTGKASHLNVNGKKKTIARILYTSVVK